MSVKQLRDALDEIRAIFAAAGAKTQSKSLEAFLDLFKNHEHQTSSQFLAHVRQRLEAKPRVRKGKGPDQSAVKQYVERLGRAGTDEAEFCNIIAEMQNNKIVRKAEADAIASSYTGGRSKWRTKQAAIEAIRISFDERSYQALKLKQVDKASRF